jgi:hypothetical protein
LKVERQIRAKGSRIAAFHQILAGFKVQGSRVQGLRVLCEVRREVYSLYIPKNLEP